MSSKTYLVIAEHKDGKLRQVTFEALQAAAALASDDDVVKVVVAGRSVDGFAEELSMYDVHEVVVLSSEQSDPYHTEQYLHALSPLVDVIRPDVVLTGHTAIGRDLAPALAVKLNAGQLSDVTGIVGAGVEARFVRPVYAGKAIETKTFCGYGPQVITIRPNNLGAAAPVKNEADEAKVTKSSFQPPADLQTVVREVMSSASGKLDLTEARIVIAGGRGVKSKEGFQPLEELAAALGGAVGASRGACDAGYCDYGLQIGQTGKVVTPELYIACGISGAIQHVAGMSGSRIIVAVNKDPEAPIFKIADYGIVGDLFEVVPLLTKEILALREA